MDDKLLYAFFGHHKCASTWTQHIIDRVVKFIGLNRVKVNHERVFGEDIKGFLSGNSVDFLSYVNADYKYVSQLDNFIGFHIIRDPRDIAISSYFSHLYSHSTEEWPELINHRKNLEKLSLEEGIFEDIEFTRWNYEHLATWNYSQSNVLEIKMEILTNNPYEIFPDIFNFLGLLSFPDKSSESDNHGLIAKKIPIQRLLYIIYTNRFSAKSKGRAQGDEDIHSHYRKGAPGDWKNYFSPELKKYFKQKYGELLIKLGYEKDTKW